MYKCHVALNSYMQQRMAHSLCLPTPLILSLILNPRGRATSYCSPCYPGYLVDGALGLNGDSEFSEYSHKKVGTLFISEYSLTFMNTFYFTSLI